MDNKKFDDVVKKAASKALVDLPEHQMWYVPILKGKMGEFGALKELSHLKRSKMTPLIEVPSVTWDYSKEEPAKTVNNHVNSILKRIVSSSGNLYPIYLDVHMVDEIVKGSTYTIDYMLKELHSKGVVAVPVVRLSDTKQFLDAVKINIGNIGKICLRINQEEFDNHDLLTEIPDLIKYMGISYEQTDLLLDMGYLTPDQESMFTTFSKMTINAFPNIDKFSSLIIAMTSFPENLTFLSSSSSSLIPRSEWLVWKRLYGIGGIKRKPVFADYGISNPILTDVDPRIMQMSANIRYTTSDGFYIIKGRGVKSLGFGQFYDLSEALVNSSGVFYGPSFSWGDKVIDEKSRREGGTGSATTWRQVGTNHHLCVVIYDLNAISPSF